MNTQYKYLHFVAYKGLGRWDVQNYLWTSPINSAYRLVKLNQLISPQKTIIKKNDYTGSYSIVEKIAFKTGQIVFREENKTGMDLCLSHFNELLVSSINFHQGAVAINTFGDIVASTHYKSYYIDASKVLPSYLVLVLRSPYFLSNISASRAKGIKNESGYNVIGEYQIPLPSLAEQQALVDAYRHNLQQATELEQQAENGEKEIDTRIREHLQFSISMPCCKKGLNMVHYKETSRWDPSFFFSKKQINSSYPLVLVKQCVLNFMTDALGKSLRRETSKTPAKEYTYIGMENVEKNKGTLTNPPLVKGNTIKSQTIEVPNGYMIYGKLRPYLNKYWLNVTNTPNIVCSSEFFVFDIKETLNKLYFEYILASSIIQEQILNVTSGARMPRINEDVFYNLSIPLPPLDVQAEIVAEVQAQRAKIAERKTTATTLRQEAITQFEQAIFE